ncbi:MAG TPA: hypothetical protein VFW65_35170 [Pseudonocardiaceae bacterium]|nr:hypothetical protein [Pseudonocardiaceae bacterium]
MDINTEVEQREAIDDGSDTGEWELPLWDALLLNASSRRVAPPRQHRLVGVATVVTAVA